MNAIPLFLAAALTSAKPTVVTTTFPIYDWAREIVDTNRVELVLLQQSGADLHSYSPTADDMKTIARCDLFIYNGGESDGWVERVLAKKVKELDLPFILATEGGSAKIAETVKRTAGRGEILVLDSLQSVTGEKARTLKYLDVMKRNLEVLKKALN